MEDKLFDLLGLGVPFYLAAATYGVFAWLDNNASDEVTKVISSWLHGRSRNKPDLGNLIIKAFDRIYTSPLLSFRAFGRSAIISTIIWLLFNLVLLLSGSARLNHVYRHFSDPLTVGALGTALIATIFSDYISLFFVKPFLKFARTYPLTSSFVSSFVGLIMVTTSLLLFAAANFYFILIAKLLSIKGDLSFEHQSTMLLSIFVSRMKPAFIIHLWLPLFALSSLIVKLLYPLFRAVEWARRFLKQGDAHPFKAIGIVATIIVFGSAMLVKEGWALLSVLERS